MRKDNMSFEDTIKRAQELAGIKPINEGTKGNFSTLTYSEKIKDTTYGIVKENGFYFIKSSNKELIKESTDFDYIGGLANKNENRYPSYADALKNLNMIKITITESLNDNDYGYENEGNPEQLEERLQQDIDNEQPPMAPGESPMPPQQQGPPPAPAPGPEPMPSELPPPPAPAPEGSSEPQPEGMPPEGAPTDDSDLNDAPEDDIDHYLGKLTYKLTQTPEEDLSEDKIKAIMNSVISAIPWDRVSPEERLQLARRVKRGGAKNGGDASQEGQPQDSAPAQEPTPEPTPEPQPEEEPLHEEKSTQDKIAHYKKQIEVLNLKIKEANKKGELKEEEFVDNNDSNENKRLEEKKYPWDKCEKNAEKEYGSKKTADKVCGAIKAKSEMKECDVEEDKKINEFYSKIDRSHLIYENDHLKYKNVLIESNGKNMIRLSEGDKSFIYNVTPETVKKHYSLVRETKVLNENKIKLTKVIK